LKVLREEKATVRSRGFADQKGANSGEEKQKANGPGKEEGNFGNTRKKEKEKSQG